jgi:hypothetical protein
VRCLGKGVEDRVEEQFAKVVDRVGYQCGHAQVVRARRSFFL